MTEKQVKDKLVKFGITLDTPERRSGVYIREFCKLMEPRQYGTEETADAFLWFEKGWLSARDRLG